MDYLDIQISGKIRNSNFPAWKNALLKQIHAVNLELITDNDFANAAEDAKVLKKAEKAIQEAKIKAIEQTEEIQALFSALDEVSEKARQIRLTLERQVRAKKQDIKNELITGAIREVQNYIAEKPEIFRRTDHSQYLQRHQYEAAIKGRSSILSTRKALASLVQDLKSEIDEENRKVLHNHALIENIPADNRLLFQDVNYLVKMPEQELKLTIENRMVKLSEQKAIRKAENVENEINAIDDEALSGIANKDKNHYTITIDLLCTRQEAINLAREIKNTIGDSTLLKDMKLAQKHDTDS